MRIDEVVDPDLVTMTFPCLRARQPIGDIYVATISYKKLIAFTYFDVRRILQEERDFERYLGIQRPLDPTRVKALETYVNLVDASFPTSVIVALDERYVSYDDDHSAMTIRNYREGEDEPSLPLRKLGRVLDGQHRIAGLERFRGDDFDLTVTLFVGSDIADQAHIFATVNIEQTKVNKSLVYDLYDLAASRSPQKTCHNIVVALDRDPESPFYRRVKRLGLATVGNVFQPVTQSTIVEGLIGYISAYPKIDRDLLLRGKKLGKIYGDELFKRPLRNMFIDEKEIEMTQLVYNYFDAVRRKWPQAWEARGTGFMLNRTNGVRALLRFFRFAYAKCAAPGDMVSSARFYQLVFQPIDLKDADFNIVNFVPGTSGEARLFRILRGKEKL